MPTDALATTIDDRLDDYRDRLFELLAQPSVSTTGEGMDDAADLVVETLADAGLDARAIETSRYPVVYAERGPTDGSGAADGDTQDDVPTVLFYGHYDVQPPGDDDEWESPAFEPTIRDGSIYARGAGDNKGQFAAHAFAVDALLAADAFPDVEVKLVVEGGEESGSDGLREYLRSQPAELADVDLVYVADGPRHAVANADGVREGKPTLIYGNRGVLSVELDHRTANTDLHSGNFGGPVPAATNELVEALSSMRAADGDEVVVDGFHDGIEVTEADRELVAAIPDDAESIAAELELTHFASERPYYERLLTRPTLTINGLSGGYQGEGTKTVLPAVASAKFDCRLVPGQDPDAVFEAIETHLDAVNPDVEATKHSTFPPMKTPVDTPAADPVDRALETVWGESPIELPVLGGSLPAAYFREVDALADVPVLVVPYANHDQGNHSPNEHLDVDCFENGVRTSARVIEAVAEDL
ncbi:M20/M25/M40 family metallo-hydrolase [Halorubrum sp. JWXQ-INN 858]|uniref:M20/M25/M40 family metallo-hydrolase n=1 Tax=Halorubrum sp. JWXQ-INN 858 TaxID=2690782 RepID=UPI00135B9857|nr:M20/M25/M40 family metallo-hydrolase [Halorubrum sp. JWXQ-INN 858]MWV65256.1 M20/M25/M40 family metallo-hydrolase [Halorubrum sp. JWXQ-INN 858]